ncbi:unnamed protein product [Caenorhabditis sp. 36 PRJEB53466]|nr:unnamed protein product [Caenorhabditis sp. 36 PRJEB53466]
MLVDLAKCILFFLIGCNYASLTFKNSREYDEFLGILADQKKDRMVYTGPVPDIDKHRYQMNRHKEHFTKCASFNSSSGMRPQNDRCTVRSYNDRQGCYLAMDFTAGEMLQGCHEFGMFDNTCNDSCVLDVKRHRAEGSDSVSVVIGFCCCLTQDCNNQSKELLDKAYADFLIKEEMRRQRKHQHHERKNQKTMPLSMGFYDRYINY